VATLCPPLTSSLTFTKLGARETRGPRSGPLQASAPIRSDFRPGRIYRVTSTHPIRIFSEEAEAEDPLVGATIAMHFEREGITG